MGVIFYSVLPIFEEDMKESTPEDREKFFNSLNPELLNIFDDSPEDIPSEFKFPFQHEAMTDEEGEHLVKISNEIGRGGMKVIYKCTSPDDGKVLALATLKNKGRPSDVERFLKEAKITQKLQHYNIIRVYDHGINDDYGPYMAMNYVEGCSLAGVISGITMNDPDFIEKYPLTKRLKIFKDVASAIDFAHTQGIVHLDLKPENILIDTTEDRVYICDWGLSKMLPEFETTETANLFLSSHSQSGVFVKGSPGYMAPEQVSQKEKNIQTDIYQLGAILYAIVFFKAPIDGEDVDEIMENTVSGKVELPDEDNSIIIKVIKKALSTNPEDRFKSVEEMLKVLNSIIIFRASKLKTTIRKSRVTLKINANVKKRRRKSKRTTLSPGLIFVFICLSVFILWTLTAKKDTIGNNMSTEDKIKNSPQILEPTGTGKAPIDNNIK